MWRKRGSASLCLGRPGWGLGRLRGGRDHARLPERLQPGEEGDGTALLVAVH